MPQLKSLPPLENVLALSFHEAWTGMSPHAPRVASFNFEHTPSARYQGRAWFQVAGNTRTTPILSLRAGSVRRLFEAIGSVRLVKTAALTEYVTDHHPSYEIGIHLGPHGRSRSQVGGLLTLYSESCEDHRAPWLVTWKGESAWTESQEINAALLTMRDDLKMRKLDEMWAEASGISSDLGLRDHRRGGG